MCTLDRSVGQICSCIFQAVRRSVQRQYRDFFLRVCVDERLANVKKNASRNAQAGETSVVTATDATTAARRATACRKKCSLTRSRPYSDRRTIRRKTMPASTPTSAVLLPSSYCGGCLTANVFRHSTLFLPACRTVLRASCLST